MGHLLQIFFLIVIVALLLQSWSILFLLLGIEIVSLWRHQYQHHPADSFAKPIWLIIGLAMTFLAVYAAR